MLKSPRRLPRRYNRRVTSYTDKLVRSRHARRKRYARERLIRLWQRLQRRVGAWRKTLWWFVWVLAGGFVILGIGLAFFSPILTLREIRVRRTDPRIEEELVQSALRPLLGRHLLFFTSSQDVLPLLTQVLPGGRSAVPDLREAVIRKDYPSSLVVQLALDPLIARVSFVEPGKKDPATQSGTITSDFVTDEGMYVAYLPSQVQSGSALPLIRAVDWGHHPEPWKTLLDEPLLQRMRETERSLSDGFGLQASERVAYLRAREFHLQTPSHALWFDLRSSLDDQLDRYRLFLRTVPADQAKMYVDLRLADRVVYR